MPRIKLFNPKKRKSEPVRCEPLDLRSLPPSFEEVEETLPLCSECHYNHLPQEDLTWPFEARLTLYPCERFCEECHEDDFDNVQQLREHIITYHGEVLRHEGRPGGVTVRRRRVMKQNGKGAVKGGAKVASILRRETCPASEAVVEEEDDEGGGEEEEEGSRSRKRKSEEYGEPADDREKSKKQMREEFYNSGLPHVPNGEAGIADLGIPEGTRGPTVTGDLGILYNPDKVIKEDGEPTTHLDKGNNVHMGKNLVKVADLRKMPPPPLPPRRESTPGPSSTRKRGSAGHADNPSTLKRKPKTRDFSIFHTINESYDHRHNPPPAMAMGTLGIPFDPAEVSYGEEEEESEEEEGVIIGQSSEDEGRKAPEMSMLTSGFRHGFPDNAGARREVPETRKLTLGFRHGTPDNAEVRRQPPEISMLSSGFRHATPDVVMDSLVPSDDAGEQEEENEEGEEQGGHDGAGPDKDAEYELDD
ncbi:hypothetical protein CERZMDRAFT_92241 [Cercospora zeae-maydis SCOH1-5]|uniref:Uncharacterized protein n=1 Tax=Cercospora zeae-maydis SCOH1-5 TaxID=717836 RepID=A0A6A6FW22_9PEZI|nr:hypothetical protein CERZMDRAFT_92241 [Cercospora zeae-maydis SCOH1-5]